MKKKNKERKKETTQITNTARTFDSASPVHKTREAAALAQSQLLPAK